MLYLSMISNMKPNCGEKYLSFLKFLRIALLPNIEIWVSVFKQVGSTLESNSKAKYICPDLTLPVQT